MRWAGCHDCLPSAQGPTPQGGLSCSSGAIHLLPTSARIVSGWRIFHMNFFVSVFLSCLRRAPFWTARKGPKSRLRRGMPISPALTIHPLKRPRRGNCDSPFLELPPSRSIGSFPAAGAYSVTPPPLRPVWKERPRNTGVGLVPARGRHEPDAPDCHTHSPNFNREVTP